MRQYKVTLLVQNLLAGSSASAARPKYALQYLGAEACSANHSTRYFQHIQRRHISASERIAGPRLPAQNQRLFLSQALSNQRWASASMGPG